MHLLDSILLSIEKIFLLLDPYSSAIDFDLSSILISVEALFTIDMLYILLALNNRKLREKYVTDMIQKLSIHNKIKINIVKRL